MLESALPPIGLSCPKEFPDIILDKIIGDIEARGLQIHVKRIDFGGPYAAFEWALPTVITAYILKPYFESFLQEAGKDHYTLLKDWLKKVTRTAQEIKVNTVTADQSTEKLKSKYSLSKACSITVQTKSGKSIKLLFNNEFDQEDWNISIDILFEFILEDYHSPEGNANAKKIIVELSEMPTNLLYAIYDKEKKVVKLLDDRTIIEYYRSGRL